MAERARPPNTQSVKWLLASSHRNGSNEVRLHSCAILLCSLCSLPLGLRASAKAMRQSTLVSIPSTRLKFVLSLDLKDMACSQEGEGEGSRSRSRPTSARALAFSSHGSVELQSSRSLPRARIRPAAERTAAESGCPLYLQKRLGFMSGISFRAYANRQRPTARMACRHALQGGITTCV